MNIESALLKVEHDAELSLETTDQIRELGELSLALVGGGVGETTAI